jgi:hypothetical protein
MGNHLPSVSFLGMNGKKPRSSRFLSSGRDIQILGILLILAGTFDLMWIAAYPQYALKVFGTTFSGWAGEFVKYQHPVIHWALGYGFLKKQLWAFWGYLVYLGIGCLSELTTQVVEGFHTTRTTIILISLLFGGYILLRRPAFLSSSPSKAAELQSL